MADKIELQLFNIKEFDDEVLWATAKKVAKRMLNEMKTSPKIPKDTGEYVKKLDLKFDAKERTITVFENAKKGKGQRLIGHLLENGTSSTRMHGSTPAQPHWDYFEEKYKTELKDELIKEINQYLT